ncbi:MAG: COX15/CtaA family protein [Flavisolibacter sp.]
MQVIETKRSSKPVAIWLLAGVFMIIIQIIIGGITRLTDSGLSITEWKPILGSMPPMNDAEWQAAFEKYKQIAQFKHLHSYFSMEDFKSIYFWEWLHRNWGRLIGIVFIIPFLIFLKQKRIDRSLIKPMIILFLLGGLQGIIGWIMVQSGLNEENLYVSHIRLSIHFLAAVLLLVYVFWMSLKLLIPQKQSVSNPAFKKFTLIILVVVIIQLVYGAFMAGLRAGPAAPTWPDINGSYIPGEYFFNHNNQSYSFTEALFNNKIIVQFIHRNLAYLIFILIIAWTIKAIRLRQNSLFNKLKWWPSIFVFAQLLLGIASVLTSPQKIPLQWGLFEWNALLHQLVAMMFLLSLVFVLFLLTSNKKLIQSRHLNNR